MSATASTTIAAPPSTVFDILADPRRHPVIDGSGTVTGTVEGPERLELGSKFGMTMKQGASYKTVNKVVEFEPDKLIAWHHKSPHRWRYELTPEGAGTKVTETWDTSYLPGPMRFVINRVFGKKTQRGIEQTLVKLKAAAEKDAASA